MFFAVIIYCSLILKDFLSLLPFPESWTDAYAESMKSPATYGWVTFFLTVFLAPVSEEVLYRGLMFRTMRREIAPVWAILISSLVFGLDHNNILQKIYAFLK